MYPNLRAEIARQNLTLETIVSLMNERGFNLTVPMLSMKLNGKYKITLGEAKALKEIVKTRLSIDELFKEDE